MNKIIIHSAKSEFRALLRGAIADITIFVSEAKSRQELFTLCENTPFDIVFTDDVRMFMNGSRAIDNIRPSTMLPQIFLFAHDLSEDTVVALLEMGVNQFITLPFSPERLRNKITKRNLNRRWQPPYFFLPRQA